MTRVSEIAEHWFGLCRKPPALRTAPALIGIESETVHPVQPDGSGPAGRPGRIRYGISIAAASLKALVRDRQLLWFTFLSGLVMLFLILAEGWSHRFIDPAFPVRVLIGGSSISLSLQYLWVGIPIGDSHYIFYWGLFLIEMICLSGFIFILAGLVLYRSGNRKTPVTVRGGLSVVRSSFGSLAALSVGMALLATIAYDLIYLSPFFAGIIRSIMELFWLPYAYYEPQNWTFSALYFSAYFYAIEMMIINFLLILAALYLVPAIVLEKKGLIPALSGSVTLFRRTWREVLGCLIVFGLIAIGVFAVGLLIGQSPALLNHDYDFFISRSRGYLLMMVVCYGFIVSCWVLMAAGFTAAGVAIADLYRVGKSDGISGIPEGNIQKPEPVV
ncbi:MAG: hypothetical protein Q7J03_00145 [Methanoregula sp.]|nr:hypothetical protein [Methanoregula sp.]